jgi:glycosyltransferase involved in cell wall biosynthesis
VRDAMNMGINGIRLMGRRFGVGRYIEYLLQNWETIERPFEHIRLYTPNAIPGPFSLPGFVEHRILPTRLPYAYWEQVVLPRRHHRGDLLFCPSYVVPLAFRGKLAVTHLGSYEALPGAFRWHERIKSRVLFESSARRADLVITVSHSSKADIVKYYKVPPEKIIVIPLGVDPKFRPTDDDGVRRAVRARYFGDERPFMLFVGKLTKRRNIPDLIEAFAALKRDRHLSHGLLLVGEDAAGVNIGRLVDAFSLGDSVVHRDYETHESLIDIYNAAELFVYPSSYEGFGMPVLEAMACGVPTIAVRNSAFLEFAAGAYLCDDASAPHLYEAMATMLDSSDLRARLRRDGLNRSRAFHWDRIAARTMDALAELARA